jgi:hypothetical protein
MRMFTFEADEYRDLYRKEGWVHIKNGVAPDFLEVITKYAIESFGQHKLEKFAIKGKKEQAIFEFADDVDYPDELFDLVASLCELNRSKMTLSERHIQSYELNAVPEPAAHKDRFASQISVGLSIQVPEDSRLVLYPNEFRDLNTFNQSAALYASLAADERPEVFLKQAREVEIADEPGDVVVFPGASTWHLRRRSAGAVNLYLKFNDFGADPLGEDAYTAAFRACTLEVLADLNSYQFRSAVPALARRLDTFAHRYTRNWDDAYQATLYGEDPFTLSGSEFDLLRGIDGQRSVGALAASLASTNGHDRVEQTLRRLASRGIIDLVPSAD